MVDSKGNTYKSLMEIRYADVLLMYAESMNEQSKMTSDIWDKTIKPLRERADSTPHTAPIRAAATCAKLSATSAAWSWPSKAAVYSTCAAGRCSTIRRSRAREPHTSTRATGAPLPRRWQ